jgi:protein-arginine kinase activator protein McsA
MKKTYRENYRVVVEPRGLGDFGSVRMSDSFIERDQEKLQKRYKARCESIVEDIKRHVDDVSHAYVESDEAAVCSHCGSTWTEKTNQYNGGCCDADQVAGDAMESVLGFFAAMSAEAA